MIERRWEIRGPQGRPLDSSYLRSILGAMLILVFLSCFPLSAQQPETDNDNGAPLPHADFFDGEHGAARGEAFEAALRLLDELADTLPGDSSGQPNPQAESLREATRGLRRMRIRRRIRIADEDDLRDRTDIAVTVTEIFDRTGPAGEGAPEAELPERDPVEDSHIIFRDSDWVDDDGGPGQGGNFCPSLRQIPRWKEWALAITLWHEWQHAADGAIESACLDVRRHICIVLATREIIRTRDRNRDMFPTGSPDRDSFALEMPAKLFTQTQLAGLLRDCVETCCGPEPDPNAPCIPCEYDADAESDSDPATPPFDCPEPKAWT